MKYSNYRRLWDIFKGYRKFFLVSVILNLCAAAFTLIIPSLAANFIDIGIVPGNIVNIETISFYMLVAAIISGLCIFFNAVIAVYAAEYAAHILRLRTFEKIQKFSHVNIDRFQPSDLMVRLTSDTVTVKNGIIQIVLNLLQVPFLLALTFVMVYLFTPYLLELMTVFLILFAIILLVFILVVQPKYRIKQKKMDLVNRALRESLSGIRVIKAFVSQNYEIKKYALATDNLRKAALVPQFYLAFLMPSLISILLFGIAGVYYFGGIAIINDTGLQIGTVTTAGQYLVFLLIPVFLMAIVIPMITSANSSLSRIFEVLDAVPDIMNPENPVAMQPETITGRIVFDHVFFRYPGSESKSGEAVLSDINLIIEPGERIGILGATGSGKSTLISLIPRFYDVSEGKITIDGVDVRDIDLLVLRKVIGVCQQEVVLFSGNIRDTISFGSPNLTYDEVSEAAKASDATGFIENIPGTYESQVSRRGANFSGGQRQRLSIARTLALKPKILILDDSTSACDVVTEANIQDAINELMTKSTIIFVAQRISSIITADRIIILDSGKITASGTHEELLATCIQYQEIYNSQLGERGVSSGGA